MLLQQVLPYFALVDEEGAPEQHGEHEEALKDPLLGKEPHQFDTAGLFGGWTGWTGGHGRFQRVAVTVGRQHASPVFVALEKARSGDWGAEQLAPSGWAVHWLAQHI